MLMLELQSMRPFVGLELIAVILHSRALCCRKYLLMLWFGPIRKNLAVRLIRIKDLCGSKLFLWMIILD